MGFGRPVDVAQAQRIEPQNLLPGGRESSRDNHVPSIFSFWANKIRSAR